MFFAAVFWAVEVLVAQTLTFDDRYLTFDDCYCRGLNPKPYFLNPNPQNLNLKNPVAGAAALLSPEELHGRGGCFQVHPKP